MTYDGASHKRKLQQEYRLILKWLAGQRAMTLFILSLLLGAYGLACYEAGWHHKGKEVEDIVLNSQYHFQNDPQLLGRKGSDFPLKRCCQADGCLVQGRQPRHAVITYIRTDAYLPLLQQLECTVRKSNPWVELGVMLVRGELSEGVLAKVQALNFTINYVEPLSYPNKYKSRFTYNWLKVRAFGLTDYDAILLLDSDTAVIGDIQPLFSLPTDFAASWNQWPWQRHKVLLKGINAGVLLIRPCRATEQQMLEILTHDPKFRFEHGAAEQDFFDWYFHYTVMVLPLEWNVMASFSMEGGLTLGGVVPRIVHFTEEKPFNGPISNAAGHEYLCQLNA